MIVSTSSIYVQEWTTWVPTFVGWTATPTYSARYRIIGKMVEFQINVGTASASNSTATTFTLPVLPGANVVTPHNDFAYQPYNNGAFQAMGVARIYPAYSICELYLSATIAWTASGNKAFFLVAQYEID